MTGATPQPPASEPHGARPADRMAEIDDALAAAPRAERAPGRAAALWAVVWLGALGGGAAAALTLAPEPWRAASPAEALLAALAVTAPVAICAGWARLAARIDAEGRRLDALGRRVTRAPAAASVRDVAREAAREAGAGLTRADLTHAVAHAARDALDRERSAIARQLAELGDTQRRLDAAVRALGTAAAPEPERPAPAAIPAAPPRAAAPDAAQPPLPLPEAAQPAAETAPEWSTLARALDFPRDSSDEAGFAALEAAMRDRDATALLQAAEDALTLLAQHGLYMEDLEVRHASAAVWRNFAAGKRGREVAGVGAVQGEAQVAQVRELMKADPVFRDTAMHLMRRFDGLLRRAAREADDDARLLAFADSRTGRAFMLVAQAVGTFD